MTPSGKKINVIKPNKVTSISPRRGGKGHHSESKKENFTQKKFDGKVWSPICFQLQNISITIVQNSNIFDLIPLVNFI